MEDFPIVVIAASAGGVEALHTIFAALPARLGAAFFIVMHTGRHPSLLPDILTRVGPLPVSLGRDGEVFEKSHGYVAPANQHMLLRGNRILLDHGPKVHHARPAADPLFRSAALSWGPRVIGVVLTGGDSDGTDGMRAITGHGGMGIVQDPDEAQVGQMPDNARRNDHPQYCVPAGAIAPLLVRLIARR